MESLKNKSLLMQSETSTPIIIICSFLIIYSLASMFSVSRLRHYSTDTILFIADINSAPPSEISILPGIGLELASKIVNHRERFGEFGTLHELKEVVGIGDKKIHQMRPYVYFGIIPSP